MTEQRPAGPLIAAALGVVVVLVGVTAAVAVSLGGSDDTPAAVAGSTPSTPSLEEPRGLEPRPADLAAANSRADLNVTVVASQFTWTFNYTKGGSTQRATVWESAVGDELPTLWLVKDRSVTFGLYSPDVIHSFWLPDLLFKTDVVPGRAATNFFTVTPTEPGTFTGRCAELCGEGHSRMLFAVKVVEQAVFDAHLADLADAGHTGLNVPEDYQDEISAG